MKKKIILLAAMTMTIATVIISCETKVTSTQSSVGITPDSLIRKGEYLVSIIGCDDCHSPKKMGAHGPEPDIDRRFSGYPADRPVPVFDTAITRKGLIIFNQDLTCAAGPWGISFSANISGDETGIGNWTEEQFKKALTQGKWKGMEGTRMLLPPMPWEGLSNLKDDDVKAIFAYLKSTKPVKNVEPAVRPL